MTEQEAIEIIKYASAFNSDNSPLTKALDMAIEALEKQIPKKPDLEGDGYADGYLVYDTWICPNCGKHYEVDYEEYDWCPNCGQHIDRSKEAEAALEKMKGESNVVT